MKQAVTPAIHVEVVQGGFIITTEDADDRLRGEQSVTAGSLDDLTCVLQSVACTHLAELVEKIKDAPEEFPGHPARSIRSAQDTADAFAYAAGPALKAPIIKGTGIGTPQTSKPSASDLRLAEQTARLSAQHWRNAVMNLDKADQARATSQMRTIIARIEEDVRAQPRCDTCDDTGWVARGTIRSGVPFSHNYMACPKGCDGGRGFSDPIPYDKATGKIVTDTEDDGA